MEKPRAVYYLLDPETRAIRYVGISTDPVRRYKGHLTAEGFRHSANWIRSVTARGLIPILQIIVWASEDDAKRIEIALIARFSGLTNISTGGEGGTGVRWSDERKAAHSMRVIERYASLEARAAHSAKLKVALNNPDTKARQSAASIGRVQSAEVRAKKSETLMGHAVSASTVEKMRLANIGRKASEETKLKMRLSHTGHAVTEETRAKISRTKREQFIAKQQSELGA